MFYLAAFLLCCLGTLVVYLCVRWAMTEDRYRWNVFYERIDGTVYEVCYGNHTYSEMVRTIKEEEAENHVQALYMEKYFRRAEEGTGLLAVQQLKYW